MATIENYKGWWYFIFGADHEYTGMYVKIYGTLKGARDKMNRWYGTYWVAQYSEELFKTLNYPESAEIKHGKNK